MDNRADESPGSVEKQHRKEVVSGKYEGSRNVCEEPRRSEHTLCGFETDPREEGVRYVTEH